MVKPRKDMSIASILAIPIRAEPLELLVCFATKFALQLFNQKEQYLMYTKKELDSNFSCKLF